MKSVTKTHVIYFKIELGTCTIQIQVEKVWFVAEKLEKFEFEKKNSKGGTLMSEQSFFSLFQSFKILFWKMASIARGKCSKKQSHKIWACLEHPLRNQERSSTRGGSVNHPPCRIGLNYFLIMVTWWYLSKQPWLHGFNCALDLDRASNANAR